MSAGWSGSCAADLAGISYRQLDYWARTDLCRPSLADATGQGSRRRYSYLDLLRLRAIAVLLDAGLSLERLRPVFADLPQHTPPPVGWAASVARDRRAARRMVHLRGASGHADRSGLHPGHGSVARRARRGPRCSHRRAEGRLMSDRLQVDGQVPVAVNAWLSARAADLGCSRRSVLVSALVREMGNHPFVSDDRARNMVADFMANEPEYRGKAS